MIPAQMYNNQFSNVTCVVMSPSPRKVSRSIEDLNTKLHNPPLQANPQPQLPNRLLLIAFYKVTAVQTFYPPIFNKYTAICASCQVSMENKLQSSPFPPNLCPCCHQASNGLPYSLCSECLESIHEDGYADSSWGSWHLNRSTGQILCIGLDFD